MTAASVLALSVLAAAASLGAGPRLTGRVLGPGDRPLDAVRVKIYVGGTPATTTWADSTGAYTVEIPSMPPGATVMAWFIPVNDDLSPECLILAESPTLSSGGLLPCVPRLRVGGEGAEYSVTLLGPDARLEKLKALPCFAKNFHEGE